MLCKSLFENRSGVFAWRRLRHTLDNDLKCFAVLFDSAGNSGGPAFASQRFGESPLEKKSREGFTITICKHQIAFHRTLLQGVDAIVDLAGGHHLVHLSGQFGQPALA